MFENVALTLQKMMGLSGTLPGAILAADVPVALSRFTAAINAENASPPVADEDESVVSMANRGLPLIDLLTAATKADCNVM